MAMDNIERVLIDEETIQARIAEIAAQIKRDYYGTVPLLVGILKGSVVFMADLVRKLDIQLEIDFMSVSSYGANTESSGVVRILKDLDCPITDRDVWIVEDILDTGLTLDYLIRVLEERGPKSMRVCTLLYKRRGNQDQKPVKMDYLGFAIENEFVVGYGLDYAGLYRNIPYIGVLGEPAFSG
ncbi:MAG: hypoxanthine phosphoribosyltransferase [Eubacteriaceae bacterium]|jgi:hypoxanthine phosphoribosyltransferase|nr:hypoxanthine phosphoribosyltransferase [Eubacteriaceae bacterium]